MPREFTPNGAMKDELRPMSERQAAILDAYKKQFDATISARQRRYLMETARLRKSSRNFSPD